MQEISWLALAWCLLPMTITAVIFWRWQQRLTDLLLACARMFLQLIAMGYVLVLLFQQQSPWISLGLLALMLWVASWIALRPVRSQKQWWPSMLLALLVAVSLHLFISVLAVLQLSPWYSPQVLLPLGGMYFANSMNTMSLAAERFATELGAGKASDLARRTAFKAAMIPQINGLLAVGLVALPGMMTGQILAGVSPLVAVRYQVMIMSMLLGCSAVGSALLLSLIAKQQVKETQSA